MEKGYRLTDVAEATGMEVRTVRQWVHDGKLKATKIPGTKCWVVKESEMRRLQDGEKSAG